MINLPALCGPCIRFRQRAAGPFRLGQIGDTCIACAAFVLVPALSGLRAMKHRIAYARRFGYTLEGRVLS